MTQVNTQVIQSEKAPKVKELVKLAALRGKAPVRGDAVASAPAEVAALKVSKKGLAEDPLANFAGGSEQATGNGQYYPPIGMPAIYFAMKALLADLKSGLAIAKIDNNVMKNQFENWISQMNTYAEKSKEFYTQQANEQLAGGIASIGSVVGNSVSLFGSVSSMKSGETEIDKLTKQKTTLQNLRFTESELKVGNEVKASEEVSQPKNAKAVSAEIVPEKLEADASKAEPITVQRTKVQEKLVKLQEDREADLKGKSTEEEKVINHEYDNKKDVLKEELKKLDNKDSLYESQIKDLDTAIGKAQTKQQAKVSQYQNIGYIASGLGDMGRGIAQATIGLSKAQTKFDEAMSETLKQVKSTLAQAYQGQVDAVYRAIDQQLSALEQAMKGIYAAQQSGAA